MKAQDFFTEFDSPSFLAPPTQAHSGLIQEVPQDQPQQDAIEFEDANDFSLVHLRQNVPDEAEETSFYGHNQWQNFDNNDSLEFSYISDKGSLTLKQQINSIAKIKQNQLDKYQWSTGKLRQSLDRPFAIECPRRNLQGILDSADVKTACHSALTPKEINSAISKSPGLLKKPIGKAPKGTLNFKQLMST